MYIKPFFLLENGNLNGDPDNGGAPRIGEDGKSLISDVRIKRLHRNAVVQDGGEAFESGNRQIYEVSSEITDVEKRKIHKDVLKSFIDKRWYGDLDTENNSRTRGAFQVDGFFKSTEAVDYQTVTITRALAHSKKASAKKKASEEVNEDENLSDTGKIGKKSLISRAVYTGLIAYDPMQGYRSKVSEDDAIYYVDSFSRLLSSSVSSVTSMPYLTFALVITNRELSIENSFPKCSGSDIQAWDISHGITCKDGVSGKIEMIVSKELEENKNLNSIWIFK
jgi:hypothetical protein